MARCAPHIAPGILCCALAASAQVAAPPAGITIRTATRLVQVSVIATGRSGAPVADLHAGDFVLREDGRPQKISVFSLERGGLPANPPKTLPAGFFSNRLEYRGGVPMSATVLLLDRLNTPPDYFGRARPHIARFLHQVDPRFRIAIYSLGRELKLLHDFTSDSALLTRKVGGVQGRLPEDTPREWIDSVLAVGDPNKLESALRGAGGDILDLMAYVVAEGDRKEREFRTEDRIVTTLEAVEAIARRLSAVPGRKNLVWISTGFPLALGFAGPLVRPRGSPVRQRTFTPEFERALRALGDASVAVYPVDARGLLALGEVAEMSPRGPVRFPAGQVTPSSAMMRQIAEHTGGKRFFGEEAGEALPQVFEHARVSYTLGYYPSNPNYDGKFRRIQLRVNRRGVRLGYRGGYYALADARSTEDQWKSELLHSVWSPVDATAVSLDASLERAAGAPAGDAGRTLSVYVDGRSLVFEPRDTGLACPLELYIVQKDAEGKQLDGVFDKLDIRATPERALVLQQRGVMHRKPIRLMPRTAILRVIVRNGGGALGSLSIPLGGT